MKALVISDDNSTILKIDECLKKFHVDSINYKWLLKALDNVEEICPDITIISAQDYPRHWKIFTQFIKSGIGNNNCKVLLYTQQDFTSEESDKAKTLGVYGVFTSLLDDESEKTLSKLLSSITGKPKVDVAEHLECPKTNETVLSSRPRLENCTLTSVDMLLKDSSSIEKNETNAEKALENALIPSVDHILSNILYEQTGKEEIIDKPDDNKQDENLTPCENGSGQLVRGKSLLLKIKELYEKE